MREIILIGLVILGGLIWIAVIFSDARIQNVQDIIKKKEERDGKHL